MEEERDILGDQRPRSKNKHVPHYHGDAVRNLFLGCAVLFAFVIPVWGEVLPIGIAGEVACILLLVLLAGLTNPHGRIVLIIDLLVAGLGAFILTIAAIGSFRTESLMLFIAREAGAIMLLFAFYFAAKTVRAIMAGTIGLTSQPREFDRR